MRVHDVMRRDPVVCHPETNLAQAAALMWDHDCGALPVVNEDGQMTGLITDRDICIALGTRNARPSDLTAGDVASGKPLTCGADDDVHSALHIMRQEGVRRLPVVNAEGVVEGILCLDDIVLRAQCEDGTTWPGISFEDVVNTFRGICWRCAHHGRQPRAAA